MPRTREENERIRQMTRDKVRTAATEVFVEQGYHAASIEAIAAKAGISKGLLYSHYKGKEALLEEMAQQRAAEIAAVMQASLALSDPRAQLRSIVDGALDQTAQQPELYRFFVHLQTQPEEDRVLGKYSLLLKREMSAQYDKQCRIFEALGAPEPRIASLYFSSALQGAMLMLSTYPSDYPLSRMKQEIMRQFASDSQ
ncbi:TetR/AcrR family transcriptional regulator [Paenibacillus sp. IB182496]|uniref:TetR/AcrR family transcriptional regulator n=1 Tax=Paenibacillus sabuli TaxID=2772509 RepID=A0A927BYA9_9BACL|nr:TetR/AcrR family transcriptional regulator [Paenibacillus sabuli]MBD2848136.1 TetR/AcrR family transcriptional regulator [Paenibacillus sabuli]